MAITTVHNELIAVNAISGTAIADNAVTSVHIAKNNVGTVQIAQNSVTSVSIALNQVTGTQIANNAITSTQLADNAVTATKIPDGTQLELGATNFSGEIHVGGTSVAAGTASLMSDGHIKAVLSSGGSGDTLIGAISGVSNGHQIVVDSSNNQTYKWFNGGTNSMILNSSGKVGIGTDTPNLKLHVEENADTWVGEFKNVRSAGGYGLRVDNSGAGSATDTRYALGVYTPGNVGLFVRNNGNVGIGTTSPDAILDIERASLGQAANLGETRSKAGFILNSDTGYGSNGLTMGECAGTAGSYFISVTNSGGSASYPINLQPYGGNVGIGTTSPSKGKLQIDGGSSGSGDFDAIAIKHVNTTTVNDGPVIRLEGSYNGNDWALAEMKAVNGGAGHGAKFMVNMHPGSGTQSSATVPTFEVNKTHEGIVTQKLNAQTFTLAANAQQTFTSAINTTGLVNIASQRNASNSIIYTGALFYLVYSSSVITEIADVNDLFLTSDSAGSGKICIYKSNATGTFYIVNRTSHTMTLSVHVVEFQGN